MSSESEAAAPVVLVTGGAGFIGSHTCAALAAQGRRFLILDNFCNSRRSVLERLERITGAPVDCVEGDVRDGALVEGLLRERSIDAVIHFAGLKAVGDSVRTPLTYYDNNVAGTLTLLEAMRAANERTLVFSSSAPVYGDPAQLPIREDFPLSATNPYGWSKLMMEQVLADVDTAEPGQWRIARLRYFNPVGAHESGLIGEDPQGVPGNLMPYVAQVAAGQREFLNVWGGDYPTPDGTGVRDYIHVVDLARGHVAAIDYMRSHKGESVFNLGTGTGYSVLDMIRAFETANGVRVPYKIAPRRAGDLPVCYADPARSAEELHWHAEHSLEDMCRDSWNWQKKNPYGYGE